MTAYEVRGTIRTTPRRVTVWTDWAEVTTSDLTVTAEIAPGTITVEMFQAGLQDQMVAQERAALAAQQAILDDIAMAVANVDAAAKLKADQVWQDSLTEVERVSVRVGEAEASIEQVRTVAASQTAQLAEQVETVRAAGRKTPRR